MFKISKNAAIKPPSPAGTGLFRGGVRACAMALIVLAGLAFSCPILIHGKLPWGSDASFHSQIADGFYKGVKEGLLYPRWLSEANRGYGSTALINYPPISSYLVVIASYPTNKPISGLMVVVILSAILSGITFYIFAAGISRPFPAAIGAILYILLPYHVIVLYERFAFAEYNSLIWLPLVFKYARDVDTDRKFGPWMGLVLSSAGLLMTHLLVAYMTLFFLTPYLMAKIAIRRSPRLLLLTLSSAVAAFLLAAIYVVPSLAERSLSNWDFLPTVHWGYWRRNMLFDDERPLGYAVSSLKLLTNWSLLYQAAIAAAALFVLPRNLKEDGWHFAGLFAISIFLQLSWSSFLWANVPEMKMILFPCRFQLFQILLTALLATRALDRKPSGLTYIMIGATSIAALIYSFGVTKRPKYTLDQKTYELGNIEFNHVQPEHIPTGVPNYRKIWDVGYRTWPMRVNASKSTDIRIVEWSSHRRRLNVDAKKGGSLSIRTFMYPAWQATLDGKPIEIAGEKKYNAITAHVPEGKHSLAFVFTETADIKWGTRISAATALSLFVLAFYVGTRSSALVRSLKRQFRIQYRNEKI